MVETLTTRDLLGELWAAKSRNRKDLHAVRRDVRREIVNEKGVLGAAKQWALRHTQSMETAGAWRYYQEKYIEAAKPRAGTPPTNPPQKLVN